MQCSACGVDVPEGSKSCHICGTKIDVDTNCPKCGVALPKDSQFCNKCGMKIVDTKVDASNTLSKEIPKNETIKSDQQTPVNNTKPSILRSRNIILAIAILLIIGVLAVFIGSFVASESALNDYNAKLDAVRAEQQSLNQYIDTNPSYEGDYESWLNGIKYRIDAYGTKVNDLVASGNNYKKYLNSNDPNYALVTENEKSMLDSVAKLRRMYATDEAAYDYHEKLNLLNSSQNDLRRYVNSSNSFSALTQSWVDGYKQRVDTYALRGNDAINSGRVYQQYLNSGTSEYNRVVNNERIITENIQSYRSSYDKIESNYNSFQTVGALLKFLLPLL
jgi:type II secretory pathway pseudopilin PulG